MSQHDFLSELAKHIAAETLRMKLEYAKKFSAGDRVFFHKIQFVNIVNTEKNPVSEPTVKGVFIKSNDEGKCYVKWEDRPNAEWSDIMYIKLDDNG